MNPGSPGSAGIAGMNFAASAGESNLNGLAFRQSNALAGMGMAGITGAGLGFNWDVFGEVLEATTPLIAAGANRISPGTVMPYGFGGQGFTPPGVATVGGQVAVGTSLGTGALVALGVGGLVLVMLLTRGR